MRHWQRSILSVCVPLLAGAGAAVCVTIVLERRAITTAPADPNSDRGTTPPGAASSTIVQVVGPDMGRLRSLEERMAGLEAKRDAGREDAEQRNAAPPGPVEAKAILDQKQRDRVARFEEEGVDPKWAPTAQRALWADLVGVADAGGGGFQINDIVCKTTRCQADLEWPDFASARKGQMAIVHTVYQLGCARSIYTPEPDNVAGPYRAEAEFDCEDLRAGGSN